MIKLIMLGGKNMNKKFKFILTLSLLFMLCACQIKKNGEVIYSDSNVKLNYELKEENGKMIYEIENNKYAGYLWNKLIKSSCIKEVRFEENIHIMEDLLFLCQISYNVEKVSFLPDLYLYYYRNRTESALNTINEKYVTAIDAYKKIIKYVEETNDENIMGKYYFEYIFSAMNIYYYLYKSNKLTLKIKKEILDIRNIFFKKAVKNQYYCILKKIKLCFCSYFPITYGKIKDKIR